MTRATREAAGYQATNDEQHLIEQAQAGDRQAFEKLIFEYDRDILGLTLHILGNREEAKDAYQETFLKAFCSINQFRRQSSFYAWIFGIATNVCLDRLRQRSKLRQEVSIDSAPRGCRVDSKEYLRAPSCQSNTERALSAVRVRERISRALTKLSTKERLVFELKHYQGLRLKQIGEMIGTTENTMRDCLYRAIRKLRAELTTSDPVCSPAFRQPHD
jgi:RNA polymerase sigma-70 factor, ECF subfamily